MTALSAAAARSGSRSTAIPPASTASAISGADMQRVRSVRALDGPKASSAAKPRSTSLVASDEPVTASVPTDSRLSRTVSAPTKPRVTRPESARGRSGSSEARSAGDRTQRVSSAATKGAMAPSCWGREVQDHRICADPRDAHVGQSMPTGIRLLCQLDQNPVEEVEARLPAPQSAPHARPPGRRGPRPASAPRDGGDAGTGGGDAPALRPHRPGGGLRPPRLSAARSPCRPPKP